MVVPLFASAITCWSQLVGIVMLEFIIVADDAEATWLPFNFKIIFEATELTACVVTDPPTATFIGSR